MITGSADQIETVLSEINTLSPQEFVALYERLLAEIEALDQEMLERVSLSHSKRVLTQYTENWVNATANDAESQAALNESPLTARQYRDLLAGAKFQLLTKQKRFAAMELEIEEILHRELAHLLELGSAA